MDAQKKGPKFHFQ